MIGFQQSGNLLVGAGSSYKKERDAKIKNSSSSGHNWNTLFLGQNAVVDALAERLNMEKSSILEAENSDSLAVRMALGETQLVAETREFLTSNGVRLDVFGQVIYFCSFYVYSFIFYVSHPSFSCSSSCYLKNRSKNDVLKIGRALQGVDL